MDDIFEEMSLDFSDVETSIKENVNLDDSYCDLMNVEENITKIENQINKTNAPIVSFQDLIGKIKDKIGTDDL